MSRSPTYLLQRLDKWFAGFYERNYTPDLEVEMTRLCAERLGETEENPLGRDALVSSAKQEFSLGYYAITNKCDAPPDTALGRLAAFVVAAGYRFEEICPDELSDKDITVAFIAVYKSWRQYSQDVVKTMHAYRATAELAGCLGGSHEEKSRKVVSCLDFLIEAAPRLHEKIFSELDSTSTQ
ncbi:hypothetical protein HY642_04135 [Candidatus Woesearchaeota archaeon]|nr:hypothetical protein [Candidatus Woesearchaeota archaeon]